MWNRDKYIKEIYSALYIKQVPFKMFKIKNTDVFKVKDSVITIENDDMEFTVNGKYLTDVKEVIQLIKCI